MKHARIMVMTKQDILVDVASIEIELQFMRQYMFSVNYNIHRIMMEAVYAYS